MRDGDESFDLSISGMHCGGCVRRVTAALEGIPGVELEAVEVGRARGSFDPDETSRAALAEAIRKIGFVVEAGGG